MNYTDEFDKARKLYPGVKRSLDTEFKYFRKTHKDWKKAIPLLYTAIQEQIKKRAEKKRKREFVPPWKHFKTWTYNRCWEEVEGVILSEADLEAKKKKEQKALEKKRAEIREEDIGYFRKFNTEELKDMRKNTHFITRWWLIDEIIEERR